MCSAGAQSGTGGRARGPRGDLQPAPPRPWSLGEPPRRGWSPSSMQGWVPETALTHLVRNQPFTVQAQQTRTPGPTRWTAQSRAWAAGTPPPPRSPTPRAPQPHMQPRTCRKGQKLGCGGWGTVEETASAGQGLGRRQRPRPQDGTVLWGRDRPQVVKFTTATRAVLSDGLCGSEYEKERSRGEATRRGPLEPRPPRPRPRPDHPDPGRAATQRLKATGMSETGQKGCSGADGRGTTRATV